MSEFVRHRKGDSVLICALAAGATRREAALQAHVNEKTVARRLAEPGFRAAVSQARDELVATSIGQLAAAGPAAVQTLVSLLSANSEHARIAASRTLLEALLKGREQVEMAERVAALEQLLGEAAPR